MGTELKFKANTDTNVIIVANGRPLNVTNKEQISLKDERSVSENGEIPYTLPSNHLIQNNQTAYTICQQLLQYFKEPRRDLSLDWRGNPSLELGDLVVVNDYIRGDEEQLKYYYVTKQEFEYAGYLRAKLEGRRAF